MTESSLSPKKKKKKKEEKEKKKETPLKKSRRQGKHKTIFLFLENDINECVVKAEEDGSEKPVLFKVE